VIPNNLKMNDPVSAKRLSTMKQVQEARTAMRRRAAESARLVIARKGGTAAKGSTRKKIEQNATNENELMDVKNEWMRAASGGKYIGPYRISKH
jgi:hypothetical protein